MKHDQTAARPVLYCTEKAGRIASGKAGKSPLFRKMGASAILSVSITDVNG
jgi:hypothetical protein